MPGRATSSSTPAVLMLIFSAAGGADFGAAAAGGSAKAQAASKTRAPRIRMIFGLMIPPREVGGAGSVRQGKSWGRGDHRIPRPRRGRGRAFGMESRSVVVAESRDGEGADFATGPRVRAYR